jgi:hypothetical protein
VFVRGHEAGSLRCTLPYAVQAPSSLQLPLPKLIMSADKDFIDIVDVALSEHITKLATTKPTTVPQPHTTGPAVAVAVAAVQIPPPKEFDFFPDILQVMHFC